MLNFTFDNWLVWKTVWTLLKKLELSYNSAIPLLVIYLKKTKN